jgi:hypothetical protein
LQRRSPEANTMMRFRSCGRCKRLRRRPPSECEEEAPGMAPEGLRCGLEARIGTMSAGSQFPSPAPCRLARYKVDSVSGA